MIDVGIVFEYNTVSGVFWMCIQLRALHVTAFSFRKRLRPPAVAFRYNKRVMINPELSIYG